MSTAHRLSPERPGRRNSSVRQSNLASIAQYVHLHGSASRSELVEQLGLTRSAVKLLVEELVTPGIVIEIPGVANGLPGRPSPEVAPNGNQHAVLAVEILAHTISVAGVGFGGKPFTIERAEIDQTDPERVAELVGQMADRAMAAAPTTTWHGTGIAIAGAVELDTGMVNAPNLAWVDAQFGRAISALDQLPRPLHLGNEADLAAHAEWRRGSVAGEPEMLYITSEIGVGGGMILNGQPVSGAAGLAGEIGHLPIRHDGTRCGCGAIGCWETEIGETAFAKRAGIPSVDDIPEVIASAAAGDPAASAVVAEHGQWVARGVAVLVNVLDPSVIVFGGLLADLLPLIREAIEREVAERSIGHRSRSVNLVASALGTDAPLLGAAEAAFTPFLSHPLAHLG